MISLDQNSRDPLYVQIYDSIRRDITENALKPGEKLMPIRKLAESLDVSRNTVENAYAQLLTEGYVTSRSGSGYVVCNVDFSPLSEASVEKDRAAASRKTKQVTSSAAIGRVAHRSPKRGSAAETPPSIQPRAARSSQACRLPKTALRTHPPLSSTSPTAIARAEASLKSRGASSRAMRFFRSTARRTHTAMDWAKWSCVPKSHVASMRRAA